MQISWIARQSTESVYQRVMRHVLTVLFTTRFQRDRKVWTGVDETKIEPHSAVRETINKTAQNSFPSPTCPNFEIVSSESGKKATRNETSAEYKLLSTRFSF